MNETDDLRERVHRAASMLLQERGVNALSVRAIAERAGATTMALYSRFGGKAGILDALYREGFDVLGSAQDALAEPADPLEAVVARTLVFREVALGHRDHYRLMLGASPDFEPSPESRSAALERLEPLRNSLERLLGADAALTAAYQVFALCHGLVSLELSGHGTSDADQFEAAVRALLCGLGAQHA